MRFLKGFISGIILLMYSFGASTFSHMIAMNHPEQGHGTMDHSTNTKVDTSSDTNKCIQLCNYIEQSKLLSFVSNPPTKTGFFSYYEFPILSYNFIWDIVSIDHLKSNSPPGEYSFPNPVLRHKASIVLII